MPILALYATSCVSQAALASDSRLSFDFNAGPVWPSAHGYASSASLGAKASWQGVGSYNQAGSATQSVVWRLMADTSKAQNTWRAGLSSGLLKLASQETDLGKLTLAFTLSASQNRPVKVKIASLDAKGKRSGGLETLIYPATPDFLQRKALDLNTFKALGAGKFAPKAPQLQLAFEIDGRHGPEAKTSFAWTM